MAAFTVTINLVLLQRNTTCITESFLLKSIHSLQQFKLHQQCRNVWKWQAKGTSSFPILFFYKWKQSSTKCLKLRMFEDWSPGKKTITMLGSTRRLIILFFHKPASLSRRESSYWKIMEHWLGLVYKAAMNKMDGYLSIFHVLFIKTLILPFGSTCSCIRFSLSTQGREERKRVNWAQSP